MNTADIKRQILSDKLVIIARRPPKDRFADIVQALHAGGIRLLEVTFDQQANDPIAETVPILKMLVKSMAGKMRIGAGTVMNPQQVQAAFEAGVEYIISPNASPDVIAETKRLGMVSIPGTMTPTEVARAYECGADIVKLFPADDLGCHYIQNLRGPLPHIPLMASGGVNPQTIPLFWQAGINTFGTGISVLDPELVRHNNLDAIAALANEHTQAVKKLA